MDNNALVYDKYGPVDVLHFTKVPYPEPSDHQIVIKVEAIALNPKDYIVRKGKFAWLSGKKFPKIIGLDFAGAVVEAGKDSPFAVGTNVYGCLNGWNYLVGTFTDFLLVEHKVCAPIPAHLSIEQAAAVPLAAQTSLQALRDLIHLKTGDRVAILGASGGVGVYAIQIAKALGAHVTTTSGEKNLPFCKELGADVTLDYKKDDVFSAGKFNGIFDAWGNQSFDKARKALTDHGIYVTTVPSKQIAWDYFKTLFSRQKAKFVLIKANTKDMDDLSELIRTGKLKPVIDKVFDKKDYVEAFKLLESRHARGKVVIRF